MRRAAAAFAFSIFLGGAALAAADPYGLCATPGAYDASHITRGSCGDQASITQAACEAVVPSDPNCRFVFDVQNMVCHVSPAFDTDPDLEACCAASGLGAFTPDVTCASLLSTFDGHLTSNPASCAELAPSPLGDGGTTNAEWAARMASTWRCCTDGLSCCGSTDPGACLPSAPSTSDAANAAVCADPATYDGTVVVDSATCDAHLQVMRSPGGALDGVELGNGAVCGSLAPEQLALLESLSACCAGGAAPHFCAVSYPDFDSVAMVEETWPAAQGGCHTGGDRDVVVATPDATFKEDDGSFTRRGCIDGVPSLATYAPSGAVMDVSPHHPTCSRDDGDDYVVASCSTDLDALLGCPASYTLLFDNGNCEGAAFAVRQAALGACFNNGGGGSWRFRDGALDATQLTFEGFDVRDCAGSPSGEIVFAAGLCTSFGDTSYTVVPAEQCPPVYSPEQGFGSFTGPPPGDTCGPMLDGVFFLSHLDMFVTANPAHALNDAVVMTYNGQQLYQHFNSANMLSRPDCV